ncbi:MAG: ABC transporter permease [Burkholderiales bacterium PBB3]|nr:MAG: ABC transporter permease [Burkholderiales bacterium PBB3]
MLKYYFFLGLRSLRRNPALTALMVLTLAVGVAASVATMTILHAMSGNPIPHKSDRLLSVVLDAGPLEGYKPGDEPNDVQSTYRDAMNLVASGQGERRTAAYGMSVTVQPERKDLGVFGAQGIVTTKDFFPMFEVPFAAGQGWGAKEDTDGADVVVLSREFSEKLFGTAQSVGKQVILSGQPFQVIGVLDTWKPLPRYYLIIGHGAFAGAAEDYFFPIANAVRHKLSHAGSTNCSQSREPGFQGKLDSECTWVQTWFELSSANERPALQTYLDNYAADQARQGRLLRRAKNHLYNVTEWLERLEVVEKDNRLAAWLSFGFLALCLVNTVGLLLAKFSSRASEVGVRRALGASRSQVFQQFLMEAVVVGLAGGVLGLLLAWGALQLIALQSKELALLAHMDWQMLALTFALSVLAAVLAGLLPTWRACNVTPALQLKSQ